MEMHCLQQWVEEAVSIERAVLFLWHTKEVGHRLEGGLTPTAHLARPELQNTVRSWKGS